VCLHFREFGKGIEKRRLKRFSNGVFASRSNGVANAGTGAGGSHFGYRRCFRPSHYPAFALGATWLRAAREEPFGPLAVINFASIEEAIEKANSLPRSDVRWRAF